MQDFPHHYVATATSRSDTTVKLHSPGLENLQSAGPAEFGGPGDLWSPETLLVAAVADCFILSFRAIARAAKFEWKALRCDVTGDLDRVDRVTKFTRFNVRVTLEIPDSSDEERGLRLLEKAERTCLITNSMTATTRLTADVRTVALAA
jgi:organic hydroperoxide reductase OsmC/OhrA